MYSEAGKQGCTPCAAGKAADDTTFGSSTATGICVNCLAGQVSSSGLKCEVCDVGYYQSKPGLPSCFECIPGQYQDVQGGTSCKDCGVGQFRQSKKVDSEGQLTDESTDPTSCVDCPKGSYQNEVGLAYCINCIPGQYQDVQGGTSCKDCGVGQFRQSKKVDSEGQLTDESTDPTSCVDCPKGSYQNEVGLAYCINCIPGQYQDVEGETKCRECQEGKHEAEPGAEIIVKRDTPTVCTECKYKCFFISFHL